MRKLIILSVIIELVVIGILLKATWERGLFEGSKQKSRQIGSVAEQCNSANGILIIRQLEGGLEINCVAGLKATLTIPGCATQSATFKDSGTPIFKN